MNEKTWAFEDWERAARFGRARGDGYLVAKYLPKGNFDAKRIDGCTKNLIQALRVTPAEVGLIGGVFYAKDS